MPEKIKPRFWNFTVENEEVVLRLEGDIIDDDWAWLYEWFGIPAASPTAFRNELAKHSGKNISLWIDSYGGSVFAAMGIYNALMEHKNTGGKIISIVDSKAMSAATIPYMAGDERLMSPGAIFMMHNPLCEAYGYASDLRKVADVLDEIKAAIINVYQLGTGKSKNKISELMDVESYMSANTAIKEGFATGMRYAKEEGKVENIINFAFNRLAIQNAATDSMKKLYEMLKERQETEAQNVAGQENINPVANKIPEEGGDHMEIKNVDDLKKAHPELANQLIIDAKNQGIAEERKRIQDITLVASKIDPALVNRALFESPIDAKELVFQAYQSEVKEGKTYLTNVVVDSAASGVDKVTSAPVNGTEVTGEKPKSVGEKFLNIVASLDAKRRGVQV